MVDEESLSCLTTLTCSQVSHFATTPDWRMELISAGLNACLFHLALTRGGGGFLCSGKQNSTEGE